MINDYQRYLGRILPHGTLLRSEECEYSVVVPGDLLRSVDDTRITASNTTIGVIPCDPGKRQEWENAPKRFWVQRFEILDSGEGEG